MTYSYNLADGHKAAYYVSPSGNVMVNIQSSSPLKIRAVYVGEARLQFMWVSSGKSSHWQFTPTLIDQSPAQYSEQNQGQIVSVELGNKLFPATGIIKPNITGEIRAPAIHFDVPYASDLWVFLLRTPWYPLKIGFDKSPLSISHDSSQAMAELQSGSDNLGGDEKTLKAYVSLHGEGFKKVSLILKRNVGNIHVDEPLGEITTGMATFNWKPSVSNFDIALITNSTMYLKQFLGFLKYLGAETHESIFSMGSYMPNNFLLSDAPAMNYTLSLVGEKGFFMHEKDETKLTLSP